MSLLRRPTLSEQRASVAAKLAAAAAKATTSQSAIVDGGDPAEAALAANERDALAKALADLDAKITAEEARLLADKRQAERVEASDRLNALAADLQDARATYMTWLDQTFKPLVAAIDATSNTQFAAQLADGPWNAVAFFLDQQMRRARERADALLQGRDEAGALRSALGRRPTPVPSDTPQRRATFNSGATWSAEAHSE